MDYAIEFHTLKTCFLDGLVENVKDEIYVNGDCLKVMYCGGQGHLAVSCPVKLRAHQLNGEFCH